MSIKEAFKKGTSTVTLHGWVYRERKFADKIFIVLRDSSDIIQCVIKQDRIDAQTFKDAESLTIESSIEVTGELTEDKRAPGEYELQVTSLHIIHLAERFPITKDQSTEWLLDQRHLWIRSRKMTAILKIRSTVLGAIHDYFRSHGFFEYQSPTLTPLAGESGSELFEVKYFDETVYLTQTWQLYAEAGIFALEKIYTIAPSFRAEKSKTSRHLTEYWHAEMEAAWCDFKQLQGHAEQLLKHIVKQVLDTNQEELTILERDTTKLAPAIEKPYTRMTYDEALRILKKEGMDVEWGKDLRTLEEDKLSSLYDTPVIITKYPTAVKAFYMKLDPQNPDVVLGFDVIAPQGYGEIIGASEREEDNEKIISRLKAQGDDPENYGFYLDLRKYGSVPHSGFGMGVERVIAWICGLDTVKDAIAFPRTMLRWKP